MVIIPPGTDLDQFHPPENADKNEPAAACVDVKRRKGLMRAHTATHLLQAALRNVLGEHVSQQGSLVDDDRLRFDFTHFSALSLDELREVEAQVNARIFEGIKVDKRVLSLEEAKKQGALAFFKDKYKDEVRTVFIADFSKELCGGTHLDNTGEAGLFAVVDEASIASGIRRIEALTGFKAWQYLKEAAQSAKTTAAALNCAVSALPAALGRLQDKLKSAEQKADNLNRAAVSQKAGSLQEDKESVAGIGLIVHDFGVGAKEELMHAWDSLKKQGNLAAFLCARESKLGIKGGGRDNIVQGVIAHVDTEKIKSALKDFLSKNMV